MSVVAPSAAAPDASLPKKLRRLEKSPLFAIDLFLQNVERRM
jgi:hypothetical protein